MGSVFFKDIIMLKLEPIKSNKVWGYELWIASTHPNGRQANLYETMGGEHPLLVKVIQADESLSIQVHPDDEKAVLLEGEGSCGKSECWYVLDAKPGSKLVYGLNGKYSSEEIKQAIETNNLEKYLNQIEVHKGDFIFIPSGTVHAIGAGLRLMEVQQSCDITYRLYDWGRSRQLHVEKSLEVIKNNELLKIKPFDKDFECDYFSLSKVCVKGGYAMINSRREKKIENWMFLYVIDGKGVIKSSDTKEYFKFEPEQIFAIAPGEKIVIEAQASIMKISAK